MVGPGHCPMISKYGPSLSKAVGPVDTSFSFVNKSHFNKNIHLTVMSESTNSTKQKVHVGRQYSNTVNLVLVRTAKNNYFSPCTN